MMKFILLTSALILSPVLTACSASSQNSVSPETISAVSSNLPVLTGDNVWSVDQSASKLQFRAEHNGDIFTGDFSAFDAAVMLDLDDPSTGEIHAVIDLSTVDAKDDDRNANLPTKAWFDIKSYPLATYKTIEITGNLEDGYSADGTLTIRGVERPVSLDFTVEVEGDKAVANGIAHFSRKDFNIGTGSDFATEEWVKFPIEVLVSITATR